MGNKAGKILRAPAKGIKLSQPSVEIVPEYAPDIDRALRGLMLLCSVNQQEIESRLRKRREGHEIIQAQGQAS